MKIASSLQQMIESIPFLNQLDADSLKGIEPLFRVKHFKKGAIIFLEGDPGDEMYVIHSGLVRIYRFDEVKKVTLAFFSDGDYFGEMALMDQGQVRSATAETMEPTIVFALSKADFEKLLFANPRLIMKLLEFTMERLRKANEQIQDLTFLDVRMRIIKMLLRLAHEHGTEKHDGIEIRIKLTHQQIADLVGAVRETVTKVMLELQEEQLISIYHKKIRLMDIAALENKISP